MQTITAVSLISSNAATIAAFPKDGFVMEQMTVVTMRMRPTLLVQVCTVSFLIFVSDVYLSLFDNLMAVSLDNIR